MQIIKTQRTLRKISVHSVSYHPQRGLQQAKVGAPGFASSPCGETRPLGACAMASNSGIFILCFRSETRSTLNHPASQFCFLLQVALQKLFLFFAAIATPMITPTSIKHPLTATPRLVKSGIKSIENSRFSFICYPVIDPSGAFCLSELCST